MRLLVLVAATEPLGDRLLLHRAAEVLGLDVTAVDDAANAGLLEVGRRVEFAHPLARSAPTAPPTPMTATASTAHWPRSPTSNGIPTRVASRPRHSWP
jgi:hypothetical protein